MNCGISGTVAIPHCAAAVAAVVVVVFVAVVAVVVGVVVGHCEFNIKLKFTN